MSRTIQISHSSPKESGPHEESLTEVDGVEAVEDAMIRLMHAAVKTETGGFIKGSRRQVWYSVKIVRVLEDEVDGLVEEAMSLAAIYVI